MIRGQSVPLSRVDVSPMLNSLSLSTEEGGEERSLRASPGYLNELTFHQESGSCDNSSVGSFRYERTSSSASLSLSSLDT